MADTDHDREKREGNNLNDFEILIAAHFGINTIRINGKN